MQSAQRLQGGCTGRKTPVRQQLAHGLLQPLNARGLADGVQVFLQGQLLRRLGHLHFGKPAKVRGRPGAATGVGVAVAQQQGFEAMAGIALLARYVFARPHHVANRLVCRIGNEEQGELTRASQPRERGGVAPIGLYCSPGARNRRGRHHVALPAESGKSARQHDAAGTGLVHDVPPPGAHLAPQGIDHSFAATGHPPQVAHLGTPWRVANIDVDAVLVDIKSDEQGGKFAHGLPD